MQTSRLTIKGQATVPVAVRRALGVRPGDRIAWRVSGGMAEVTRAAPLDRQFAAALSATLDEWSSVTDDEDFRDL
jgi:antitoxin PrlF